MTRTRLYFGVSLLLFSSCVPSRKIVYLQQGDLKKRSEIPKDSILRSHTMQIREYRIQPLDILSIQFESLTTEEFDFFSKSAPSTQLGGGNVAANAALMGVMVDINGEVEYPVVGKIKISGLTIFEAQKRLQEMAAQYLKDVVVRVRMLNFRYTLLGEVNGERTVISNNPRLTMMEAIGQGGGLTDLADRSHVKVIRQVGTESQIFYVNLLEEDYIESPFYYVQQNDVIIVPPLKQRTFKRYFSSNLSTVVTSISAIIFFLTLSNRL